MIPHMGSPQSNQFEVVSYRCDGKASGLWTMGLLRPVVFAILEVSPYPQDAQTLLLLVVRIASAPSATDVGGLLSTTHGWRTFGHSAHLNDSPTDLPLMNSTARLEAIHPPRSESYGLDRSSDLQTASQRQSFRQGQSNIRCAEPNDVGKGLSAHGTVVLHQQFTLGGKTPSRPCPNQR